nr:immunoglobulin heavy chain junction region [Macaca mulatta]MOV53995.1 immunoglobulin heavy chain junction region [Macaca mulatta]MOV54356.1 immunoglobulin heavy chain junction region [Macaca mulatta]MOV54486.1 immunoglobulin heavy chain junction region [Macaca mulatta]MOV55159.1 immunoglobulin heavy chain junction region [Macaca mulatta]
CAGSLHSGIYNHLFFNSFDVW